jgi:hypothetical protein
MPLLMHSTRIELVFRLKTPMVHLARRGFSWPDCRWLRQTGGLVKWPRNVGRVLYE